MHHSTILHDSCKKAFGEQEAIYNGKSSEAQKGIHNVLFDVSPTYRHIYDIVTKKATDDEKTESIAQLLDDVNPLTVKRSE